MKDVAVISDKNQASTLLQGNRLEMLAHLRTPLSATQLAQDLGITRQKANYHLRALEDVALVTLKEERKARNCTERIVQATAKTYIVSPEVLEALGDSPEDRKDRFSSAYLLTSASRTIKDVAGMRARADKAGKRLATLTMEAEISFSSAESRNAFAEEYAAMTAHLLRKYDRGSSPEGRSFKLQTHLYPAPISGKHEPQDDIKEEP